MEQKYKKALSEVNIILAHTEKEVKDKIPEYFIQYIKENMDKNHRIKIQNNKELLEQNIMLETKQIIALMYRDYICTKDEREKLIRQEKEKYKRIEKEKQEKYKINFKKIAQRKTQKNIIDKVKTKEKSSLIERKEEKWYNNIIDKILKIFKIK